MKVSTKQLQKIIKEIITEQMDEGWFTKSAPQSPEALQLSHKAYLQAYQASQGLKKVGDLLKDKEITNVAKMLSDFVAGALTNLIKKKNLMPK